MTVNINDGICAYLQGGLGNQLFIIAAGLEQAQRLNCKLYIDISSYSSESTEITARNYELEELDLPGIVIGEDSPWFLRSPANPKDRFITRFLSFKTKYVYREKTLAYEPRINQIRVGTTLYGYFQNKNYMQNSIEIIKAKLLNFRDTLQFDRKHYSRPAIHARRGDLLIPANTAYHGICSSEYFINAVRLLEKIHKTNGTILIYSDSPASFANEIQQLNFPEHEFSVDSGSPLEDLLSLSNHEALVMSNSSFSWWAGALMEDYKIVVAPMPWLSKSSPLDQLVFNNWESINK